MNIKTNNMKESIKLVFQCDFCDKRLFRKNAMVNHEFVCSQNPINKDACLRYSFCQEIEKTLYIDHPYSGYHERKVKSFKCTKFDKQMYPHKAKMIEANYPESFENETLMPIECEHFEYVF